MSIAVSGVPINSIMSFPFECSFNNKETTVAKAIKITGNKDVTALIAKPGVSSS